MLFSYKQICRVRKNDELDKEHKINTTCIYEVKKIKQALLTSILNTKSQISINNSW